MAQEQFTLRPRNAAMVLKELERQYGCMEPVKDDNKSGVYIFKGEGRIDVFKSGTVMFINRNEDYYKFRMLDMKQDNERVEIKNVNSPTLSCLNFEHAIVGSDETGKGEIFRPFIITAAYIKDEEDLYEFLKMGVTDSKKVKGKAAAIGKLVTGINSWEEIEGKTIFGNDRFVTRVVTNKEYNDRCRERNGDDEGVLDELQNEAHMQVLRELHKRHPESTIVVDDYIDGEGVEIFKDTLATGKDGIPREKIFLTTKGDLKVMAVGLASIISYYICTLGHKYAQEQLNSVYKKDEVAEIKLSAGSDGAEVMADFLKMLKPERRDEFMYKYAKCYYDNVKEALKVIKNL